MKYWVRVWGIIGGIIIRGYRGKKKRGKKGGIREREEEKKKHHQFWYFFNFVDIYYKISLGKLAFLTFFIYLCIVR